MRAILGMFSLLGLLICVAIMMKLWVSNAATAVSAKEKADEIAMPLAGQDPNGVDIRNTYSVTAEAQANGKIGDLLVTRVMAGSQMDQYFGLQPNDKIVAVIDNEYRQDMKDADGVEAARNELFEVATQGLANKIGQIVVKRGDQTLTLPNDKNSAVAAAPASAAAVTPAPAQQPAAAPAAAQPQQQQKPPAADSNDPMQQIRDRLHTVPGF